MSNNIIPLLIKRVGPYAKAMADASVQLEDLAKCADEFTQKANFTDLGLAVSFLFKMEDNLQRITDVIAVMMKHRRLKLVGDRLNVVVCSKRKIRKPRRK